MKLSDVVSLAVLVAIVFAVVWGRRRGKQRLQAALAAAFAAGGEASASAAALASNRIDLGGIHLGGSATYGEQRISPDEERLLAAYRATNRSNDHDNYLAPDHGPDHERSGYGLPLRGNPAGLPPVNGGGNLPSITRPGEAALLGHSRGLARRARIVRSAGRDGSGEVTDVG